MRIYHSKSPYIPNNLCQVPSMHSMGETSTNLPPFRHRIGLLVLADDMTVEPEFNQLAPDGVAVHASRMMFDASSVSPSVLATLLSQVEKAVTEIVWAQPNVICFACTAGSIVIGEDLLINKIQKLAPNAKATTTITAVVNALRHLGVHKVAVGTPYTDDINAAEKQYLEQHGFDVVSIRGLQISNGPSMSLLETEDIFELGKSVDTSDADGIFLSCTGLHAVPIVARLEGELRKPVITSNVASFWYSCRLGGIQGPVNGYGRLLNSL